MEQEIIERLRRGEKFYNPHVNNPKLIFEALNVDENKKELTVRCSMVDSDYSHEETWDDWDITINAFLTGEYLFI